MQVAAVSTVYSVFHLWPVAAIFSVTTLPQTVHVFFRLPAAVQVAFFVTVQLPYECPFAGIARTVLLSIASQTEQWIDSDPSAVQVAALSTVYSVSHLWPVAAIACVTLSPHFVQIRSLLPFSVQVAFFVTFQLP